MHGDVNGELPGIGPGTRFDVGESTSDVVAVIADLACHEAASTGGRLDHGWL